MQKQFGEASGQPEARDLSAHDLCLALIHNLDEETLSGEYRGHADVLRSALAYFVAIEDGRSVPVPLIHILRPESDDEQQRESLQSIFDQYGGIELGNSQEAKKFASYVNGMARSIGVKFCHPNIEITGRLVVTSKDGGPAYFYLQSGNQKMRGFRSPAQTIPKDLSIAPED